METDRSIGIVQTLTEWIRSYSYLEKQIKWFGKLVKQKWLIQLDHCHFHGAFADGYHAQGVQTR